MNIQDVNKILSQGAVKANEKDWMGAEANFRRVLEQDELHPVALSGLGGVLFLTGRYEEAGIVLKKAIQQKQVMSQSYYYWAKLCLIWQHWEEAIQAIFHSIEMSPEVADQYIVLGEAYENQGKWTSASTAYSFLLQRHYKEAYAWERLAFCWKKRGMDSAVLGAYCQLAALEKPLSDNTRKKIFDLLQSAKLGLSYEKICELQAIYSYVCNRADYLQIALLLSNGQVCTGMEYLAKCTHKKARTALADIPVWQGEYFSGKRLLVYDVEDYIDAAIFLKYMPLVKQRGGIVIFAVREKWLEVAKEVVECDHVITLEQALRLEKVNIEISLLALPNIFGVTWKSLFSINRLERNRAKKIKQSGYAECKVAIACSTVIDSCLEKVKARIPSIEWQEISSQDGEFIKRVKQINSADLLISDDRVLCHWAGIFGMPFLYLATFFEQNNWWAQGKWYQGSGIVCQLIPGEWYGAEGEIFDFLCSQVSEVDYDS